MLDRHINWKNHINKNLCNLSCTWFVVRSTYSYSNLFTIKIIYFACFYVTVEYGIFWGNLINSRKVFLQLKSKIKIITDSSSRIPSKSLFQRLELLTLSTQYILFVMRFFPQNLEIYTLNSTIHDFNTRNKLQLHKLSATLTI